MNGIIAVNKPKDYTSFDVIAVLRKKLNQKKIGHMGTLDPMATGVLPVLLGKTAKFQIYTNENEKEYIADIKFGIVTDTQDIYGKVLSEEKSFINKKELEKVLDKFKGSIKQIPPMYSAIKIGGVKLCDIARKGKEIEREPRDVFIKNLELLYFNKEFQTAKIKVRCSKGTYIRSLCHDIGKCLGCGACMGDLIRTISNSFKIEQSVSLEKLKSINKDEIIAKYVFSTDYLFKNNNLVKINSLQEEMFKNGVNLGLNYLNLDSKIKNNEIIKIYNGKKFLGLGKVDFNENILKFLKCENQ